MARKVTQGMKPQKKSSNVDEIVRERIKYIRTNKLFTQDDLANDIGRLREEVNMYEKGSRGFDFTTLVQIANALDVSTDYLLGRTEFESFDEDIRITNKTIGLSDKAINNLKQLKEYGNGALFDTINFLLEQEEYPYETEFLNAVNSPVDNEVKKHCDKSMRAYEKKNIQNVLIAIDNYFHISIDKEHKLYLVNNGVKTKDDFSNEKQLNILTQRTVNSKEIIDKVFLDEIDNKLKNARDKFQQGDDN
jgi:transcriptional regulator with XRE-family HTH domain